MQKNLFEKIYFNIVSHDRKSDPMMEGKLRYYENSKYFSSAADEISYFKSVFSELADNLEELAVALGPVSENLLKGKESNIVEIQEARLSLLGILEEADFLSEASGPNVFWFEYDDETTFYSLRVKSAPLNVAEILAERLYSRMETVVMTSATMTIAGGDFSYIRERLGVNLDSRERAVEFIAESPFNYKEQSVVIMPSFLPTPKVESFISETNELIFTLAKELKRGMLVLFTSYSHLQQAYFELRDRFVQNGIVLMAQGKDGSRTVILNRFRKDRASVLFGTDSFWEGIDVPGEALEIVIIVRIPFAVPTDPVIQAQMEEIEKNGGNPFNDFSVPEAAIKLRQGAGRLIRRTDDRGAIIILDVRIITARYGITFKKSLPGHAQRIDSPEKLIEYLKQWFKK